jgi:hypothetical protein
MVCRSHWPRDLRHRSAAAGLLKLWVRIPPGACMSVCYECCVLSDRGLYDQLITRPEESYRLWCVVGCDLGNSEMRRPCPALARSASGKTQKLFNFICMLLAYIIFYFETICRLVTVNIWRWDISFGIDTKLGAGKSKNWASNPGWGTNFSSFHSLNSGSGKPPASYPLTAEDITPGYDAVGT